MWDEAIDESTGTKYEVESTHEDGRFRLWEDQTRSLLSSDARGTAWVAFVLFDERGNVEAMQRRKPSTVNRIVRERGGWNRAGHSERDGRQHKLPHDEVL